MFKVGDKVVIGEKETKGIIGFASLILDKPLDNDYLAGTVVRKLIPGQPAPANNGGASSSGSSGSNPVAWGVALLIIGCLLICCAVVGFMASRPKKKRATEREAYLKTDFMEKQQYMEVDETQPMMGEPMTQSQILTNPALESLPPAPPPKVAGAPETLMFPAPPPVMSQGSIYAPQQAQTMIVQQQAAPTTQLGITTALTNIPPMVGTGSMYTGSMYNPSMYR